MSKYVYLALKKRDLPTAECLLKIEEPILAELCEIAASLSLPVLRNAFENWYGPEGFVQLTEKDVTILLVEIGKIPIEKVSKGAGRILKSLLHILEKAGRMRLDVFIDAD